MFKYTKRLLFDIRFWCQELKIRNKENASGSVSKTKNGVIPWPASATARPSNVTATNANASTLNNELP